MTQRLDYDYVTPSGESGHPALGWEMSFFDMVQGRIGLEDDWTDFNSWGLGLGWEFGRWMVQADYAHESWTTFFGDLETNALGVAAGARF